MRRYGNIKKHAHADGTVCDSRRELKRYHDLKMLQAAGEIRNLVVHPRYKVTIGGVPVLLKSKRYPNGRHMVYIADFSYEEWKPPWEPIVEDVKMQSGHRTGVYKIKRALMDAMGVSIREY